MVILLEGHGVLPTCLVTLPAGDTHKPLPGRLCALRATLSLRLVVPDLADAGSSCPACEVKAGA